MKNLIHAMTLISLFSLLVPSAAMADTKMTVSPELSGMDKIMQVIGHTSLNNDAKTNEYILDILEAKNEMYPQKTGAKALNARSNSSQTVAKKAPISRGQKTF